MKITLTNNFHNTEAVVVAHKITEGRFAGNYRISRHVVRRLRAELCGSAHCTCGDTFGARMRGGNPIEIINEDYERNYIVDLREER